jgi:hypothetical protein
VELSIASGILVALCGVGVGILSAMFGIGGGTVMVPLIHLAFGQPAAVASGTSLFAILPTSISGMLARLHDGTIKFRVGIPLGIAGACLSPLGAVAASTLPGVYAMVLTSCFILFTAYNMFKRVWRSRPAAAASAPVAAKEPGPLAAASGVRLWVPTVLLGALVGFISGYVGLGGGFIIVPVLQWAYGFTMKESTGTSLVAVGILAIPSFITHALLGNVAWVLGLLLIVGSVCGAKAGASIVKRVNDRALTALFAVLMVAVGIFMAVQELLAL